MKSTTSVLPVSVSVRFWLQFVSKRKNAEKREIKPANYERVIFTEEMRKDYTIICPQMSPIHFELLVPAFRAAGYNLVIPDVPSRECVDVGLKYVNNDACYPSPDCHRTDYECGNVRQI